MTRFVSFTDEQIAAAADVLAATYFHAAFIMRRELGDPVEDAPITPAVYRERRRAASRGAMPRLSADDARLALYGLGLTGEAGEVADEIKKVLFHGKPLDRDALLLEVGDVLWYVDHLLALLGFTLAEALAANDEKLSKRYPDGWSKAAKHFDHEAVAS